MKKSLCFSFLSAVVLVLSFPNFDLSFLVWVGLVPLLFLLDGKTPKAAFLWGWLTGFLFFLGTHYWLVHVTLPGMILVNLYLGVYWGVFGLGCAWLRDLPVKHKFWAIPALWVALEFIRDRLFSGFGWACLGHALYEQLYFIQIADLTGVFGISFCVVMVNVLIKEFAANLRRDWTVTFIPIVIGICVMGAVVLYGIMKIPQYHPGAKAYPWLAVVQPNIPQSRKWDPASWEDIQQKIFRLSEDALADLQQHLIIWPETSFPGYVWQSPERYEAIKSFALRNNVAILMGAVTLRERDFFNSAILLSKEGQEVARYDKLHLVPFGEFLPLRPVLGWIENFVPIGDFTSGAGPVLFPVPQAPAKFGVLICFEDTVAPVVRQATRSGAHFLVNITNDGWFKDTNAPRLHWQAAALQAVANRRLIVRAANTGVSGAVWPAGHSSLLSDPAGKTVMIEGFKTLPFGGQDTITFYTRLGDVFALMCLCAVAFILIKRKIWL